MKISFRIMLYTCLCLLLWGCSQTDNFSLTIVHTNDLHSHLLPFNQYDDCPVDSSECLGGLARITTFFETEKAKNPNILILDAGDRFTGTSFYTISKEKYLTPIFQRMPYDAMTLGNHEFDDNLPVTERFLSNLKVPTLVSNLKIESTEKLASLIRPAIIIEQGGRKMGIIGVLTDETNILNSVKIAVEPIHQSVKREVQNLKRQGVNIIIVLSHIGIEEDKKLAEAAPEIDVIVGGHSHTLLTNNVSCPDRYDSYPIMQGKTAIVSSGMGGQYVGRLQLDFDNAGNIQNLSGDNVPMSSDIPNHPVVLSIIQQAQTEVHSVLSEPLTVLPHAYGFTKGKDYCSEECPLGEYLTYLLRSAYPSVDGVVLNSGSFRRALPAGEINYQHLIETSPFDNLVVFIRMTGAELKSYLQHGIKHYHKQGKTNELLQTSGIRYEFDPDTRKILNVWIDSKPLEMDKTYMILTSSFLATGGDRYPVYHFQSSGKSMRDILKEQIKLHPNFGGSKSVISRPAKP